MYPQISNLRSVDKTLKYKVIVSVILQVILSYYSTKLNWLNFILLAYTIGSILNHSLMLAIHEICHCTAFGIEYPKLNKFIGMIANLPMVLPYSISFKKYHNDHHRYLNNEILDPDVPSKFEAKFFDRTFTKLIWLSIQVFFYALRPLVINPKKIWISEIINFFIQLVFDYILYNYFGWSALGYLLLSTYFPTGIHPLSGHFISEHYMLHHGFETFSYYGWMNNLTYNVGYHNEHHDFPNVAGCDLPKLKEIASDVYLSYPHHTSWIKVIYDFITDPNINICSRHVV